MVLDDEGGRPAVVARIRPMRTRTASDVLHMAGMSAFDALKTATVNPAKALNLEAGTIEPGKLADIIMIDGDPLVNIASTYK
jgi:imidazolonepropionase-like amidohydrolase